MLNKLRKQNSLSYLMKLVSWFKRFVERANMLSSQESFQNTLMEASDQIARIVIEKDKESIQRDSRQKNSL